MKGITSHFQAMFKHHKTQLDFLTLFEVEVFERDREFKNFPSDDRVIGPDYAPGIGRRSMG